MTENTVDALTWTGIGSVALVLIRQAVVSLFSAKNQVILSNAQDNVIKRLQDEIERLQVRLEKQTMKLETVQLQLGQLRIRERDDATDISLLLSTLELLDLDDDPKARLIRSTVQRIKARRLQSLDNQMKET